MEILSGQTALVTGASRGIGRAIAQALAHAGATVLVHCHRDRAAAEAVAREAGGGARVVQADLASPEAIDDMVRGMSGVALDVLVNNAGIWGTTRLGATRLADLDAMLDLNLRGVFWLTQACLPLLRDGARIINVSSVAARLGTAGGRSVYGATKAALDALTRNWALELAPRRIRVNAVAPGYVDTDMTKEHFSDRETLDRAIERTPLGRLGNADEVADAVLFLCSDAARWIVGQSINVSGGFWV
jgi:NAD(P)-dependent dehydrogenase (short-subunit alcohol dehydrogenase family)